MVVCWHVNACQCQIQVKIVALLAIQVLSRLYSGGELDRRPVPAVQLARSRKNRANLFPRRDSLRILIAFVEAWTDVWVVKELNEVRLE